MNKNKKIIVLEGPKGDQAPYAYDGRPYERNQSTTGRMAQQRYEQLIVQRGHLNHSWEAYPAAGYGINDLDHDEIRKTVRDGIYHNRIPAVVSDYDIEHILGELALLKDGQLINAAMILYAKKITSDFNQCFIKLARFRGRDKTGDFIDNQEVFGNIFELIRAADHFALRHLPIASSFEPGKLQRIDQPAVPALALREALVNAMIHRQYNYGSGAVFLAIFDDRLELFSPGALPSNIKPEDLKDRHPSYLRNAILANVFYRRGWVERWGTGTIKMTEYCNLNGTPEPEFCEYGGGFEVVFPFKDPMNTAPQKIVQDPDLTMRQKEIINILETSEGRPLKEIQALLGDSISESRLRHDLSSMKHLGIIDSRGAARLTVWFLVKK